MVSAMLSCRRNAEPRYFEARTASLRALAPGVSCFHNLAFLRDGITAWAFRAAIASWHLRVSYVPSTAQQCMFACMRGGCDATEFLINGNLIGQVRQHGRVPDTAAGDLDGSYFQHLFINANMYLAPQPLFGPTVLACVPCSFAFHCPTSGSAGCCREGALMSVLSISRSNGSAEPLYGMATHNVL